MATAYSFITTDALLAAFPATPSIPDGLIAITAGRDAEGDGGGATFYYDASDTSTADNGGTVRVDPYGRRFKATEIRTCVSVLVFGAVGDGSTDCTAAIYAANNWTNPEGPSGCSLPPGNYVIASSVTLPNKLVGTGGVLLVGSGQTLTLNTAPEGPLVQMFGGAGLVAFPVGLSGVTAVGYPEWFGATTGMIGFDNTAAINACIAAFPITQFQRGTYYCFSTVNFQTSGRRIQGMPARNPADTGTTICSTSATADVILVGLGSDSSDINSFPHNIDVYGIYATRSIPPVPGAVDDFTDVTTWRIWGCLTCYFELCIGDGSSHGWGMSNPVDTKFLRCTGRRVSNATSGGPDVFSGFFMWGQGAIGIASVHMLECDVAYNTTDLSNPTGLNIQGGVTDLWVDQFEADNITYPVYINGSGASKPLEDIYISGGVFDQLPSYGIYANAVPAGSSIHIEKCYFAPRGGAANCIEIIDSSGLFSLVGNQGIGLAEGGDTVTGLSIRGSQNVIADANKWSDLGVGVVINNSFACTIRDVIANNVKGGSGYCIEIGASSKSLYIQPTIYANSIGVAVDSTCSAIEVNTSAIFTAIPSGRLYYNGAPVTSAGPFGSSNLASGIITTPIAAGPIVQRFTSGSGTYAPTYPNSVKWIEVVMVGGGGGGGCSGSSVGGAAIAGTATTFGTSLLTAGGGGPGSINSPPSAGGSVTINSPAVDAGSFTGSYGFSSGSSPVVINGVGAAGGSSPFGGGGFAGTGAGATPASDAVPNTGSGGGGGAYASSGFFGSGGSAGGFIRAIIEAPSASYPFTIGTGGAGASAGGGGGAPGGNGADGIIIVTEHYN